MNDLLVTQGMMNRSLDDIQSGFFRTQDHEKIDWEKLAEFLERAWVGFSKHNSNKTNLATSVSTDMGHPRDCTGSRSGYSHRHVSTSLELSGWRFEPPRQIPA